MEDLKPENEVCENVNIQCDCDRVGGREGIRRPQPQTPCCEQNVARKGGIDSSLLFFFLLLVLIVCQSDCDIELNTLLWFFLLLVVISSGCVF